MCPHHFCSLAMLGGASWLLRMAWANDPGTCKPLPKVVPLGVLEAAMGYEAAYQPLDDSELLRRTTFDQELWESQCQNYDVTSLRQLLIMTRTGMRRPRSVWLSRFVSPLLDQLKAWANNASSVNASTPAGELRSWVQNASNIRDLFDVSDGHRESESGVEQLEAQGSGVWAEFFIRRRLLSHQERAWQVLSPWALDLASGDASGEEACAAFNNGFHDGLASLQARLIDLMDPRQDLPPGMAAPINNRPAWPQTSHRNASWLKRKPWCPRFLPAKDQQESAKLETLASLAPRISETVKQHTGFVPTGEAGLGFVFACRAAYARFDSDAVVALPCRIIADFLTELPPLDAAAAWRSHGVAAEWVAGPALQRLISELSEGTAKDAPPRLRVWCSDGVLISALVSMLRFLSDSPETLESMPSVVAPAASRLSIAVTSSGAVCFEYNGKPLAVKNDTVTWLQELRRNHGVYNESQLCSAPSA